MRDTRVRHIRNEQGEKEAYQLRRLLCRECGKIHIELPDFMQPKKHYAAAVIEAVIDGARGDCPADNSTISRWKTEFCRLRQYLEGALLSLVTRQDRSNQTLLRKNSLLDELREDGPGWLTCVTRMLVNTGLGLHTQFACCPP